MAGDCFQVAAHLVLDNPGYTLCHGLAVGRGPIEGTLFMHAWVEEEIIPGVPIVIDKSNGLDMVLPASLYYELGNINPVWRYTREEMCLMINLYEHYGPWEGQEDDEMAASLAASAHDALGKPKGSALS